MQVRKSTGERVTDTECNAIAMSASQGTATNSQNSLANNLRNREASNETYLAMKLASPWALHRKTDTDCRLSRGEQAM